EEMGLFEAFKKVYKSGKPLHPPISFYKDKRITQWVDNYIYKLPTGEVVAIYNDVTQKKKQGEALEKAGQRLILFNEISNVFLTIEDDEMYSKVLKLILNFFESKFGFFGYIDSEGNLVIPTLTRGVWNKCKMPDKTSIFSPDKWGDGIWGRTLKNRKTYCSNESFNVPKGHIPITRGVSVPIMYRSNLEGIVMIGERKHDYQSEDILFLESLVANIAPVLYARLQKDIYEKERLKAEEQLQFMSFHDYLTGIYNRTYFEEELSRLQKSRDFPISIISLDIDGLKIVNDTLGHLAGDDLLKSCVSIVKKAIRISDVFARIGGDEFAVILPRTGYNTGKHIISRIKEEIIKYNFGKNNIPLSIPSGIASAYMNSDSLIDTYKRADTAMYNEKELQGKSSREKISAYIINMK
ncbi:MAG: GGDEF domain-containing protein, partial [Actinomycetia bacterium]|nr:GGDEF domain-containing protein [Actinomycetes bacterium]